MKIPSGEAVHMANIERCEYQEARGAVRCEQEYGAGMGERQTPPASRNVKESSRTDTVIYSRLFDGRLF